MRVLEGSITHPLLLESLFFFSEEKPPPMRVLEGSITHPLLLESLFFFSEETPFYENSGGSTTLLTGGTSLRLREIGLIRV